MPPTLTNCDSCAHDYPRDDKRQCRAVDAIFGTVECSDELFDWVADNCDDTGAPLADADGCPGHQPREVPS